MDVSQVVETGRSDRANTRAPIVYPKFEKNDDFHRALRDRLDRYFAESRRKPRGTPAMYTKSAIMFGGLIALYCLLVFGSLSWWAVLPLTVLLGLAMAGVGFNIQHDGGHKAFSNYRWVNKLTALTLDCIGGSSYIWARKHNSIHHSYSNITGHDSDIDVGILGRLSPHQRRLKIHRLQHLYLWFLYGFLPVKWHVYDDFRDLIRGRIGEHPIARPKRWDLAILLGGKAVFFTMAFVIPMLLHPVWIVLGLYALATFFEGLVLSVVFQLAHCVEDAEFPMPEEDTGRMSNWWATHQVETTVDFAQGNWLLSWLLGGLNFQIEHHLFPQVCHVHYPAIAPIVEDTCKEFGVRYKAHDTLLAGIASHFRWLRAMGRPVPVAAV